MYCFKSLSLLFMNFPIPRVIQGIKFCFISFLLNFLRGIYLSINSKLLNAKSGSFSDRLSTVFQLIFSNSARKPSLSKFFVSRRYIFWLWYLLEELKFEEGDQRYYCVECLKWPKKSSMNLIKYC